MNKFKSSLLATAVALTLGITSVHAQDTAATPDRTVGEVVDDASITASIKTKLLADERTKGFDINVDTTQGSVMLSGGADSAAAKQAAGEIASSVDGVVLIKNELIVAAPGTAARTEANTATASGELRAAVAGIGDGDNDGHDGHDAKTHNDVSASASATANDVGDDIDDAWITSKVKTQLLADAAVKGTQISVETHGNVVHLTGSAASTAARAKAIEIATATRGVARVDAGKLTVK